MSSFVDSKICAPRTQVLSLGFVASCSYDYDSPYGWADKSDLFRTEILVLLINVCLESTVVLDTREVVCKDCLNA